MEKEEKVDLEQFAKVLRKGIGSRTQAEFAAACGLSRGALNRWLNNSASVAPSLSSLHRIASAIPGMTCWDLLPLCGYEVPTVSERIREVESQVVFGLNELTLLRLWKSVGDIAATLESLYLDDGTCKIIKSNDGLPKNAPFGTEWAAELSCKWVYDNHICDTKTLLYLADTSAGNLALLGFDASEHDPKENKVTDFREYQSRKSWTEGITEVRWRNKDVACAEMRLLRAIFGDNFANGGRVESAMFTGYGFYCNGIADDRDTFVRFLDDHASSFCVTKKELALYKKVKCGDSPAMVFAGYSFGDNDACGPAAVVEAIMSRETGVEFTYYKGGTGSSDDADCIMTTKESPWYTEPELNLETIVYEYAKQLNIPEFGACVHHINVGLPAMRKTAEFVVGTKI